MRFRSLPFLLSIASVVSAEPEELPSTTTHAPACTATSHTGSGGFYDLRPDMAVMADENTKKSAVTKDYFSKGYDYGRNFTLNICGAVVDPVHDVVGVDSGLWQNVSAYYMSRGEIISIGSESMNLQSRGRKLVLQYTGGSPCGEDAEPTNVFGRRSDFSYNDEDATYTPVPEASQEPKPVDTRRRKSTTISFHCDRDPGSTSASVSFVGTDPEECAYFFEVRSSHACAHAEPHKPGSVGPGSIFGLIVLIAVLVYFLGGIFYNRTVAHARGWRQLPNYSLWAGIWSFICDLFLRLLTACIRRIAPRRGYSRVSSSPSRRDRNNEAENRLIDQLDEEWED
ncbi:hypothetical protein CDV36_013533 [Fusarium kuroshium]|uniref:MRH domain-containing protein n=3 Tax=Fusarium solani species complex TaxID=232080 RepID=A0A3M2RPV1_9HYPO|nr:hypothetical protein CDV36_013533 [Fusarium kuroshium]RSL75190.1 hypothetical protein CEP51_011090 [Fusarium floridanum]RSM17788.1 hypothetical protein CDV31_003395 [Fusarium ambrosium]